MPSLASSPNPAPSIPSPGRPLRVLQVVGNLDRGGIETWLMHILRRWDRQQIAMDFLIHSDCSGHYATEAQALGSRILSCPYSQNPWRYGRAFKQVVQAQVLADGAPYDVIHSHVHHFSGQVLRLAKQLGIPQRIAHSHNDTTALEAERGLKRKLYCQLMAYYLQRHATQGLGVSQAAAADLFGRDWQRDGRWQVLYCGVELAPFKQRVDGVALRQSLGIPLDAFVVGHVGRFAHQKNHDFLLRLFATLVQQQPHAHLLLVGDGELRAEIEAQIATLDLEGHVTLAGIRSDIAQLMGGAMDCFCMPSHHEGLPLVLLEAQAAGLPCVVSEVVPPETEAVTGALTRLSLAEPPVAWAEAIAALAVAKEQRGMALQLAQGLSQPSALSILQASPFNITNSIANLEALYRGQPAQP